MTKSPSLLKSVLSVLCCSAAIAASPLWGLPGQVLVYQRPIDAMVDVTNDLGVAVLQDYAYTRSNFVFSPYGVASVLVVLYEGARGESARQIHNVLRLPWNRDVTRIGFRDIHRHLRGYFSHEGYLSGLTLNKLNTSLLPEYRRVLRFYGYDVGLADEHAPFPPKKPTTTTTTTSTPQTATQVPTTKPVGCETPTTVEPTAEPLTSTIAPDETATTVTVIVRDMSTTPGVTTTLETLSTHFPTTAATDTTKEETPTIPVTTTTSYTPVDTAVPPSTGVVEEASTATAAETTHVATTLPTTLEATTTKESTEPDFTGVNEEASSPTLAVETSTIEAATTKAAILPGQPITLTVPTSLEEITTITRGTESGFTDGLEESSPATSTQETFLSEQSITLTVTLGTESEEDTLPTTVVDTAATESPTTRATLLPEQSTTNTVPTRSEDSAQGTESGITDIEEDTLPTTVVSTSTTRATLLPEQSTTNTVPTRSEDSTVTQTTLSVPTDVAGEFMTTAKTSLIEDAVTSTGANTLREITITMDRTTVPFSSAEEDITLTMANVKVATTIADVLPEEPMSTTSEVSAAANLQATTTQASSPLQAETKDASEETPRAIVSVDLSTTHSGGVLNTTPTYGAETSTLNAPKKTVTLWNEDSTGMPELPTTTESLANTYTVSFEGRNMPNSIGQIVANAAASIKVAESVYSSRSKEGNQGSSLKKEADFEAVTEIDKMRPLQRNNMSLQSDSEDNFVLQLDTKALGSFKNESALQNTNQTKPGAKSDEKDNSTKEKRNSDGTGISWDYTMINASSNLPLHLMDKTYKMPSVKHSIRKRAVSDDPVVFFPDISLQLQNGMFDSQVSRGYDLFAQLHRRPFLIDGVTEELVPMMSYTSVFPYAYIQNLHAQALEFPLDDERYRLLILLPVERRGLRQLIYDLNSCPLRTVFEALKPTRVQAIIPSFMVEGFVILTPTLQQLGVWDVFDPRRSDLSGMSSDPELYVRNIEQAVTVVIRNYVKILDIQTRTLTARSMLQLFAANHPFLYFVVDTDTHVSLMAGKMVDPLNSRIY